jgi:LmbE family N-acetylglucosaminyl deacetylase
MKTRGNASGFDQDQRKRESIAAAGVLGIDTNDVRILDHEDCRLQNDLDQLIDSIERATSERKFDLVLTHANGDTHQDHRAGYDASIAGTRTFDGTVLLYQAPSTIPNEFRPTFFVGLEARELEMKQRALEKHQSQREKKFMRENRTWGTAQSWASFFNTPERFFEAFEVYKSFWN